MAIKFKTPEEIANEYLTYLKGLKPEINRDQQDSDWFIRGQVVGGVVAGAYADQRKISDDAFPQSARRDALERHLDLYFGSGFIQAQQAEGTIGVTGTVGAAIAINTELVYSPNGNVYKTSNSFTFTTTTGAVPVISVAAGQDQNLLEGASLTFSSPIIGVNSTAVALTDISDGRNVESNDEARERILARLRTPPAGGTRNDYRAWAKEADPSVVDAEVIRFLYGPGTVGVVLTAGTTDIDAAVDAGDPVVREPSNQLVQRVQEYIDIKKPLTDCATVLKPTPISIDVTVKVRFVDGGLNTIPAGQQLTQEQLVVREVKRAIYKTPAGGRRFGASGFVVASEIEETIDFNLSSSPITVGAIGEFVTDRQVLNLSASGANRYVLETDLPEPGTITVELF
jgi:uncharacterized phage protein gp47/JayE